MELSPPIPWTFCDPLCGIGDQAVDAENAFDNCSEDVKEAVGFHLFSKNGILQIYTQSFAEANMHGKFKKRRSRRNLLNFVCVGVMLRSVLL
ncbi:unnamed protein product [Heligmosomoides polygyrus]|uniref:Uncharacterized protein n=1 Tax=Heligmosomoides polygyrus TaxID=6339 RepID=A0A183F584_HELPZ|nr:unnamed protein product [Heligmosomoides polygyrus]